jgi:CheY-like chemotaxis protein/HPt (histidine-containing phosphotransfer) domain-containing protein
MPIMDGVETVRQLQVQNLGRLPTVIMVTAYGREDATTSAQQRGVTINSVLTKPVTPSTLLEAIGEALGRGVITETRANEKAGTQTEAMAVLAGARVLLVEDNELNQELAMELLRDAGMDVVLACNGKEALDVLAQDAAFDGVLMDCQMPVMDGYEATRLIRQRPQWRDLPVIAMTANAMVGDREKVLAAGMNDHIAKPIDIGNMFATLARWISPRRAPPREDMGTAAALPGIDLRAALAGLRGNERLLRRLVRSFLEREGDFAARFTAARRGADLAVQRRLAHDLQAQAGTLGMPALRSAAMALELGCCDGADTAAVEARFREVSALLGAILPGLRSLAGEIQDID